MPHVFEIELPNGSLSDRLSNLWTVNYQNVGEVYSPVCAQEFTSNGIIFLSLNPSFGGILNLGLDLQLYPQPANNNHNHPHFHKFSTLAQLCNLQNWSCMDLLFVRGMQYDIEAIKDSEFILNQAAISLEIIQALNPCIVVVSNSLAARILLNNQHRLGLNFQRNDNNILNSNGLFYIIDESKYLGSRRHWYARLDLRENLVATLNYTINFC